jgi:hypothetical protein
MCILFLLLIINVGWCEEKFSPQMTQAILEMIQVVRREEMSSIHKDISNFPQRMNRRKTMDERKFNGEKPLIFVTGPESSGNRYTVKLLIEAGGCHGKSGHDQPLDHKKRNKQKDWSILDTNAMKSSRKYPCATIHRSFPHNNNWVDLVKMAKMARNHNFEPHVIVLFRDPESVHDSQVKRKHVPNIHTARANTQRAYLEIFHGIIEGDLPYTRVIYEHLEDREYVKWVFNELGLKYRENRIPDFKESNLKHHRPHDSDKNSK